MNFPYITINVRNFNSNADFRENATYKTLNLLIITVIQDMK